MHLSTRSWNLQGVHQWCGVWPLLLLHRLQVLGLGLLAGKLRTFWACCGSRGQLKDLWHKQTKLVVGNAICFASCGHFEPISWLIWATNGHFLAQNCTDSDILEGTSQIGDHTRTTIVGFSPTFGSRKAACRASLPNCSQNVHFRTFAERVQGVLTLLIFMPCGISWPHSFYAAESFIRFRNAAANTCRLLGTTFIHLRNASANTCRLLGTKEHPGGVLNWCTTPPPPV